MLDELWESLAKALSLVVASCWIDVFPRMHSVFLLENSLLIEICSLLFCAGNFVKSRCVTAVSCPESSP